MNSVADPTDPFISILSSLVVVVVVALLRSFPMIYGTFGSAYDEGDIKINDITTFLNATSPYARAFFSFLSPFGFSLQSIAKNSRILDGHCIAWFNVTEEVFLENVQ